MKTTISFEYNIAMNYAINLFLAVNEKKTAYKLDKRTEAIMIMLGIDTALRISDLLTLKYSDIEVSGEYGKPLIHTYIKKTKKEITLPISFGTLRHIENYKNWVKLVYGESEYIFFNHLSKNKTTYSRQWAHKRLVKANNDCLLGNKVEVAGAHSLRKTGANHIYEITKDIRDAQYLLGHKNIMQTETYLAVDKKKALERLCTLAYN
jgi:integrase